MDEMFLTTIIAVLALAVGFGLGFLIRRYLIRIGIKKQQQEVEDRLQEVRGQLQEAKKKADETVLAARDEALKIRNKADKELDRRHAGIRREEERLQLRREKLDHRQEKLEQQRQRLNKRQSALDKQRNRVDQLEQEREATIERVARLSREEAKQVLLESVREESRQDMARVIRQVEAEVEEEADARARKIITYAMQRIASEQVADLTVSTVPLPSDNMKGRIIGRGGRNIRAFEQAAGVDVVVDDTPEAVTISCFDPVRREFARQAMERLVVDGRIHPTRIEKVIADSRKEVARIVREAGEQAAYDASVPGLNSKIIKLLGRLKFRTSYGQNQHTHAVETAKLANLLAEELGADAEIARVGGLLHDIGKAVDFDTEGTHAHIGAEICRRYGIREEVIHCIEAHHHEIEQNSIEAVIIEVADAISGARPGARRESLEFYLKRIRTIEKIAKSFKGVKEAYAIQAGREIRIIVKPDKLDDLAIVKLSRNVANKLEENMQYPGQIKVTVIREVRAEDYAK